MKKSHIEFTLRNIIRTLINEQSQSQIFDISPSALKDYKQKYTGFNFSTNVNIYGINELIVDIPKRRIEVKIYPWNGKVNAQVTNLGLSHHNTLDDALDTLYSSYGYEAPKNYGNQQPRRITKK